MQIVIDIPEKEFGIEIEDKFQDFFKRLEVETKEHMISGTNLLCGAYELKTIQMLMQALAKGTPHVTPQPKTGHWIKSNIGGAKVCSVCNAHMGLSNFKFCPNCGAKMVEQQESEVNNG